MSASDAEPSRPSRSSRVIVVGGGVAGLVVAHDLVLGGMEGSDVTVLEASDRWGGQLVRHSVGGIELDAAAESFATRGGTVADLARQLGLTDDVVTPRADPAWLFRSDGSAVPLPATSVLGIPAVPMASDVLAIIGFRAAFRAQLDSLMPGTRGAKAQTLGELVRLRMGSAVLEELVAPVVRGVHSVHPDELALDRAAPGLRQALLREGSLGRAVASLRMRAPAGSQVAGIRGGVWRITDRLVADLERWRVDLRLGVAVAAADADGVVLRDGGRLEGTVVVAAPGVALPSPGSPAGAPASAPAGGGRAITLVTLVVDAQELDAAPRGTGLLVATGAPGVRARALTHATAKWEWLREAADGRHVLRLSYDDAETATPEQALRDARVLLGVPIPALVDSHAATWVRGVPTSHSVDGMSFAGEAGSSTGLAAVVREARERAERLLAGREEPGG